MNCKSATEFMFEPGGLRWHYVAGSALFRYGKYTGRALKVMQAVSIFASKRQFLVPLAGVLPKSSASSIEIPIKMLIFAIAYTSFCCFKCKRSSVAMLSDSQYQTHCGADQEVLLVPLNVGTARREDSPLGMSLPAPLERNIRRYFCRMWCLKTSMS